MTNTLSVANAGFFMTTGKRLSGAMLALMLGISGCTTTNPYTGEQEVNKTSKGAGIGALAGLTTAILVGGDRKKLLMGAGIGALVGGGVGYYMDRQEDKLRQQLQSTGVSVTRMGDNITLNMPGNITFATDSSDLNPAFFDVLTSVGKVLTEFDKTVVEVAGHTDSTGSEEYNQGLSERRAQTVSQYLSSRGISGQRLITVGMGELRPVADNSTAEGRAANRRVEITMVPLTSG